MNTSSSSSRAPASVLFAGLVFGAGLPFVYAVALRVMTIGATTYADPSGEITAAPKMSSRLFSGLLIAVVVAGVVIGLMISWRPASARKSASTPSPHDHGQVGAHPS